MFDAPFPSQTPPPGDATLSALVAKAERGQWNAADVLGGREKITLPVWLPGKFYAAVVSQFYHGELATIRMCRKLLPSLTDPAARRLVELQIIDERRHAGVYRAYLEDIGPLQPIDPMLEAAYETALSWDGDDGAMLAAFTIILEGEALFVLNDLSRWLRCPRFHRINAGISRDEARHYAFGRAYLSQVFPTLGRRRRLDVYSRLRGLWHDTALGILERFRIPNFILSRRCRTWVDTGWRDHRKALIGTGLVTDSEMPMAEGRPG
jgi:hypothetical protein